MKEGVIGFTSIVPDKFLLEHFVDFLERFTNNVRLHLGLEDLVLHLFVYNSNDILH